MVDDSGFFVCFVSFVGEQYSMSDYLKIAREIMRERQTAPTPEAAEPLEAVLKGQALELWSDALGERFWFVADEDDAVLLGESRGNIYTAAEGRFVVQIADPGVVAEVHRWKRQFNGTIRDCQRHRDGER
jgi:hypothetical protein